MSLKDDIQNTVGAVKDTLSEASHQSTADAEHTRREVAGDTMTPQENAGSIVNELKNTVQGGADHAKVEARKEI